MITLIALDEIKDHLHIDHDLDDSALTEKIETASAVLLAWIQGSRDQVIDRDGKLIQGEALSRMKGATMRLAGMLYRNPDLEDKEDFQQGELPFSVSMLIYDLRRPTII